MFIVAFLAIANMQISFKPFVISLPYWHRAVGLILIVIGLVVYNIGENLNGYKKGFQEGVKSTIHYIEDNTKIKD